MQIDIHTIFNVFISLLITNHRPLHKSQKTVIFWIKERSQCAIYFIPVRAMPSMNCFWNAMKTIAEGIIINADAAITAVLPLERLKAAQEQE